MKNNTEKPLVSVIIPAYNHEQYIQDTINSIINQTYKNIELIIVDDGSKDLTFEKIKKSEKDCKKRFVNLITRTRENKGTTETLNELISLSSGDYVYLIASDDVALSSAIEKEVAFLEKHTDYVLVVGDNQIIDSEGKTCYWDKERNIVYNKSEAEYIKFSQYLEKSNKFSLKSNVFGKYKKLYFGNHIPNGYLIRKSILNKISKFTKDAPLEDWFLMLQLSKYGKMKFIQETLFSYRWHNSNTIKNIEKIIEYQTKTQNFENKIIENTKIKKFEIYAKYGVISKKQGIPYILELATHKKHGGSKTKILSLFNIAILKFTK